MTHPAGGAPDGAGGARTRSWRDWYVLALAAGAALFCLGPSLVGARTLISVNFLTDFLPWSAGGNDSAGHQFCQSDTVDSVMPAIAYTRQQIFSGHLGSWQSLSAGGGPMSALPNTGLLDPLSLPYWILPLRWAPAFVALLCWAAAMGGTFLFLRRLSVGRAAATLAGFVFATSGFMVMWTNWPQTRTAALIPALFWATDRVATRSRPSDAILLGAVVASMLLGGFPAVTGYALYAAGGYFLIRVLLVRHRDWSDVARRVGLAAGGLVLGGALSAVQMLPFADFFTAYDPTYRASEGRLGLPLGGLATTFAPATNGLCVVGKSGLATAYGPVNPVELVAYVGSAAVVLAVLGAAFVLGRERLDQRGIRGFFAAVCVGLGVVGWASPTARSVAAKLPVFSNNFIGRARSLLGFGLAVLAAFGFDWLTSRRAGRPRAGAERVGLRRALWPAAVLAFSILVGYLVLRASHRDASAGHYLHAWDEAVWIPTALLVISALVAAGAVLSRRTRAVTSTDIAFVILPVLAVVQGAAFFHTVNPGDDPKLFYPTTSDHRYLAAHLGHDRFASAGLTLDASTAYYYGLRSATGHEFTDPKWLDLLRAVDPKVMASATNADFTGDLDQNRMAHEPILDQMGVKYAELPPTDLAGVMNPLPPAAGSVAARTGTLSCTVPGGPLRGVTFRLAELLSAGRPPTNATVHVKLSAGNTNLQSGLYLSQPTVAAGTVLSVPVAGEDLPAGTPFAVTISVTGSTTPLVLAGTGSQAACATVAPKADGLKLVYAGPGAVIYQRLTALPRIRWASGSEVVSGGAAQIAALQRGIPPSSVLLAAPGPAAAGRPATVDVTEDSGDRLAARVDAAGAGYLVVADPMQLPGWSATVDGHPVRLLHADYAMVAVAVGAGKHSVAFTYRAPGQRAGAAITATALVVSGFVLWWDRARATPRQRRRRRSPEQADT